MAKSLDSNVARIEKALSDRIQTIQRMLSSGLSVSKVEMSELAALERLRARFKQVKATNGFGQTKH